MVFIGRIREGKKEGRGEDKSRVRKKYERRKEREGRKKYFSGQSFLLPFGRVQLSVAGRCSQHLVFCYWVPPSPRLSSVPGSYGCLLLVFTSVPLVDSTLQPFHTHLLPSFKSPWYLSPLQSRQPRPIWTSSLYCHSITSSPVPLLFIFPTGHETPWGRNPSILLCSSLAHSQVPGTK